MSISKDSTHWTMIATEQSPDEDRPAHVRVTTTRSGARMVTLTEVDFTDDKVETWLVPNKTALELGGEVSALL